MSDLVPYVDKMKFTYSDQPCNRSHGNLKQAIRTSWGKRPFKLLIWWCMPRSLKRFPKFRPKNSSKKIQNCNWAVSVNENRRDVIFFSCVCNMGISFLCLIAWILAKTWRKAWKDFKKLLKRSLDFKSFWAQIFFVSNKKLQRQEKKSSHEDPRGDLKYQWTVCLFWDKWVEDMTVIYI